MAAKAVTDLREWSVNLGAFTHVITVRLGPGFATWAEVTVDGQAVGRLPKPTPSRRRTELYRDVPPHALHVSLEWAAGKISAALFVDGAPVSGTESLEAARSRTARSLGRYDRWFGPLDWMLTGWSPLLIAAVATVVVVVVAVGRPANGLAAIITFAFVAAVAGGTIAVHRRLEARPDLPDPVRIGVLSAAFLGIVVLFLAVLIVMRLIQQGA
jgi:hypothetical protein